MFTINDLLDQVNCQGKVRVIMNKDYVDDSIVQSKFLNVKRQRKQVLADYIKKHNGVEVDVDSIFDIQVKRLHEYKRQLMNALKIMFIYDELQSNPNAEFTPQTFIFGAKAAPGYDMAKEAGVDFAAALWAYDVKEIHGFMRSSCERCFSTPEELEKWLFDEE